MDHPKISVVTVCFNAVDEIEETMLSVLDQTYDNVEYIIIDGGSTDGTVEIIKKYSKGGSEYDKHINKVSYWVSEHDHGIYNAMNKGIDIATGDYINFMNAGDKFLNDFTLSRLFKNEIKHDVIYGKALRKFKDFEYVWNPFPLWEFENHMPLDHQSTFVKKDILKENKFNEQYRNISDYIQLNEIYKLGFSFYEVSEIIAIRDMTKGITFISSGSIGRRELINYKYKGMSKYLKLVVSNCGDKIRRKIKKFVPTTILNYKLNQKLRKDIEEKRIYNLKYYSKS